MINLLETFKGVKKVLKVVIKAPYQNLLQTYAIFIILLCIQL